MTARRTKENPRLSKEWQQLVEAGEAPGLGGRSAEEERRNQERKHRITPYERGRRRLSLTVSEELIAELREICKEQGYANADGEGYIASLVVEPFLWMIVDAYRQGWIVGDSKEITSVEWTLRWNDRVRPHD